MEQNYTIESEKAQLTEQVTINMLEITDATIEQSTTSFLRPSRPPPLRAHASTNEEVIEKNLERSLKQRLTELPDRDEVPDSFLISRIPDSIRAKVKDFWDPWLVSVGPYHRGRENLRVMEKQKVRFLRDFLARSPSLSVEGLIEKMKSLESRARQYYRENIELDSDQFVEMLLLDACFIGEFINKCKQDGLFSIEFGFIGNTVDLFFDMLLLENQIPFFVLESILDVSDTAAFVGGYNFLYLEQNRTNPPSCQIAHLVHLCYQLNVPLKITPYKSNSKSSTMTIKLKQLFLSIQCRFVSQPAQNSIKESLVDIVLPSASELCEAGITFKKKQSPLSLLDITFNKGIIEMPPIFLDINHKRILINLLAFEQSKYGLDSFFLSSYLHLMQYIVRTSNDMKILRQCGIISNFEPNEEESASFFNHIADMIFMESEKNLFHELFNDIKDYYEGSWHQYRAKLKRDYFNSPWSIISLGAGFVLLVLTFLQTVYGIKSSK